MERKSLEALLNFRINAKRNDKFTRLLAHGSASGYGLLDNKDELKPEYKNLLESIEMLAAKGGKPEQIVNLALKYEPPKRAETADQLYSRLMGRA